MKIVSACLAGIKCNWQGKAAPCKAVIDLVAAGAAVPVCPEQLGGLTTPREPAEQRNARVVTISGKDVADSFRRGAEEGLKVAQLLGCKEAILKARSPSCGVGKIYDGTFTKNIISGNGVFVQLLQQNGVKVISEEDVLDSVIEFPKKWYQNSVDCSWL